MRVFVSEFVCSGAWPEPKLPPSLAREGRAMLLALIADLAKLPDITVSTAWDARLGDFPLSGRGPWAPGGLSPGPDVHGGSPIDCTIVGSPADEPAAFRRLAADADATYVVAPELDDLLTRRCEAARSISGAGQCLNASRECLHACSDKWETYQSLSTAGVATVPTAQLDPHATCSEMDFPLVVKPRFGAGSTDTFLVHDDNQFRAAATRFASEMPVTDAVVQPFVAGRSVSVAAIIRSDGRLRELWPIGEQRLADDGRFTYLGGGIPAGLQDGLSSIIVDLVMRTSDLLPGARGYIGFDLIVPDGGDQTPLIVDVNPRLTTSFLGYRALSRFNLAGRILWPDNDGPPLDWSDLSIEFDADGSLRAR